jgi:ATP-dependent Clp protease ATP-binding subunit ClpA
MFERFTKAARAVVIDAQGQARRLEHCAIGTEHLLLALLAQDGSSAMLLRDAGVTTDKANATIRRVLGAAPLGADDAAALRAIGIDLDEVRARIEENFGPVDLTPPPTPARRRFGLRRNRQVDAQSPGQRPITGHIPFSRRAKKVLELSLREAVRLGHRYIGSEHILLGLLREGEGLAALILTEAGVDFVDLRQKIETSLRAAA